jgi:hypothetical protein
VGKITSALLGNFTSALTIELVQPLSLLFTALGLTAVTVWVAHGRIIAWWQALWLMTRLSTLGATHLSRYATQEIKARRPAAPLKQHVLALVLPLSIGFVFLVLLTEANPLLARGVTHLTRLEFLTEEQVLRALSWGVLACLLWPYVNLREAELVRLPKDAAPGALPGLRPGAIFNADAVRNSLVLFNAMFLVQTVLDLGVLSGGTTLPEGMSYAQYAHRGAYPLAATALLAGLFAIASHHLIEGNRMLRGLLYLWLGQTLFLVLTAVFRLALYVEAYALTYLRVAAFIWMGLVFVGLVLTVLKIATQRDIGWLIRCNLISLGATLYVCCFVNFAYVIADYNQRAWGEGNGRFDGRYLCGLGAQALPVIQEVEAARQIKACHSVYRPYYKPPETWRDWGFRHWRLGVYLEAQRDRPVL